MNRREAIAALVSLPATTQISVATLRQNDVLVVTCPGMISDQSAHHIEEMVRNVWPQHKVLVLTCGLTLSIARGGVDV